MALIICNSQSISLTICCAHNVCPSQSIALKSIELTISQLSQSVVAQSIALTFWPQFACKPLTTQCPVSLPKPLVHTSCTIPNFPSQCKLQPLPCLLICRDFSRFNPLYTTKNLNCGAYIKIQLVPRSKHTPSQLHKPVS
jgi:hypothetical protein